MSKHCPELVEYTYNLVTGEATLKYRGPEGCFETRRPEPTSPKHDGWTERHSRY